MSAAGEYKAWFRYGTTVSTCNNIHYQKTTVTGSDTKETSLLTGIVVAGILLRNAPFKTHCCHEYNRQGHKDEFCTPLGGKTMHKQPQNKNRRKTQTVW